HQRKRRRKNCAHGDAPEAPTAKMFKYLVSFFLIQLALERFFTALVGDLICYVAAQHAANGGHHGIVSPPFFVAGSKPNGKHVHAAGERDDGIVEHPKQDQTWTAQTQHPFPDKEYRKGGRR